jgi:hypothetical protein
LLSHLKKDHLNTWKTGSIDMFLIQFYYFKKKSYIVMNCIFSCQILKEMLKGKRWKSAYLRLLILQSSRTRARVQRYLACNAIGNLNLSPKMKVKTDALTYLQWYTCLHIYPIYISILQNVLLLINNSSHTLRDLSPNYHLNLNLS